MSKHFLAEQYERLTGVSLTELTDNEIAHIQQTADDYDLDYDIAEEIYLKSDGNFYQDLENYLDYKRSQNIDPRHRQTESKEQRYQATMVFNVYANDDEQARQMAEQIANDLDSKYDNRAAILDVETKPFGMKKGRSISESNEETGLIVYGSTQIDNNRIGKLVRDLNSPIHGEWNSREGYWFIPESPENLDALEGELEDIFVENGISARFEGSF